MKILHRYIIWKFLSTFVFMVLVLIAITVVIDVAEKIDDFINKRAPIEAIVFDYYFNFIPFIVNLFSPVCVFLSVIYFSSRMAHDTEIVAILSSGVSLYRLLNPYMAVAILLAMASFFLNAYWVPDATRKRIDFEFVYVKNYRVMEESNIHKKVAHDTYVYLHNYNQYTNEGHQFSIERFGPEGLVYKLTAQKVNWLDSAAKWRIYDATVRYFEGEKERLEFRKEFDTTLILSPGDIFQKEMLPESLPLDELKKFTELERERGSDIIGELEIEQNERYAYPFASIILTMIGVALSTRKSRGGIAFQLGLGLFFCFVYIVLLFTTRAYISESFPAWIAIWMPNFIFFLLGIFLLRIAPK